jgi:hypothetical protein
MEMLAEWGMNYFVQFTGKAPLFDPGVKCTAVSLSTGGFPRFLTFSTQLEP